LFDVGPTYGQVLLVGSYDSRYGGRLICDSLASKRDGTTFRLQITLDTTQEPSALCEQAQNVSLGELAAGSYSLVAQLVRPDGTLFSELSTTFAVQHRGSVCNVSPPDHLVDLFFDGRDADAFIQRYGSDAALRASLANIAVYEPRTVNGHVLASAEFDPLADPDRVLTALRTSGEFSLVRYYGPASCGFSPCGNLTRKAVEFFNALLGQYFYTDDPAELASLDAGSSGSGWVRTGESFDVIYSYGEQTPVEGKVQRVYRFWNALPFAKSAHFFTVSQQECAVLRDSLEPGWQFEGSIFWAGVAQGGTCTTGTALYRVYNNGMGGAPAHRFTTRPDIVATMTAQGWVSEGVAMCVGNLN
jgi:hypothetical protein